MQILVVLLGISFLTFLLTELAPGDPAQIMLVSSGVMPTPSQVAALREQMGFNDPFLVRYLHWLAGMFHGDFGMSYSLHKPVADLLLSRFWPTMKLALLSLFFMMIVSIPLGVASAVRKNTWVDFIVRGLTFFGVSLPNFWVGLLLMLAFCIHIRLFPAICSGGDFASLVLPAVTLAIAMASKYTRQVRTTILDELNQDYVVGARARGVSEHRILWHHVFPNALLPLVTMLGLSLGSLLGGTAVVEVIFTYPGLGNLAVAAITSSDYNLIQGYGIWIAFIYMVINLLVDISYTYIDPRLRLSKR